MRLERDTSTLTQLYPLLEQLPVPAYVCGTDGLITYFNTRAAELWGRAPGLNEPADRFCGSFRLWTPDGEPLAHKDCWMALALRSGEARVEQAVVIERPDGSKAQVLANISPLRNGSGQVTGAVSLLIDVTERHRVERALRFSEERFAATFRHAPLSMCLTDVETGRILEINDRLSLDSGYSREDVVGKTTVELGWLTADMRQALVETVRQKGYVDGLEMDVTHRNGQTVNLLAGIAILLLDGRERMLSLGLNITRRKSAEAALQAAERALFETQRRMTLSLEAANVGLWDWDLRTNEVAFSSRWKAQLGYAEDEIAGLFSDWHDRVHPDDLPEALERVREAQARGSTDYESTFRMRHKDGSWRWIMARGLVLSDDQGRPASMLGIHLDITDRKRAEESQALFRTLLDHAHDAIEVIDPETGQVLDVNERACLMHGLTRAEYLSRRIPDLDPTVADPVAWSQAVAQMRAGPLLHQGQHRRKDGSLFPVEVHAVSVRLDREYLLAVVRDITERQQIDEERRRLEARVVQSQKLESLGVLAGGIAHDFNNLLSSIMGYAELAARELPPACRASEFLAECQNAAQRAAELTRQMLACSGRGQLVVRVLRLDELVREMNTLLVTVVSKKARVCSRLEPARIEGDATQVRQLIMNLITNASEALCGQPGTITLRTGVRAMTSASLASPFGAADLPDGEYSFLEVEDSGCGMTPETMARIFDPFFTTKAHGRGLGLAAALGIVQAHRGALHVESRPGAGCRFRVFLPSSTSVSTQDADVKHSPPQQGSGTVLVVEDEASVRTFLCDSLKLSGYHVLSAGDGAEGLEVLRAHSAHIGAILLDLTMPRMDGWEVLDVLQSEHPGLPVILMSGYSKPEVPRHCAQARLAGILQKPFRTSQLVALLKIALPAPGS